MKLDAKKTIGQMQKENLRLTKEIKRLKKGVNNSSLSASSESETSKSKNRIK